MAQVVLSLLQRISPSLASLTINIHFSEYFITRQTNGTQTNLSSWHKHKTPIQTQDNLSLSFSGFGQSQFRYFLYKNERKYLPCRRAQVIHLDCFDVSFHGRVLLLATQSVRTVILVSFGAVNWPNQVMDVC